MTTAAIMLVRDERDIVEPVIRHLLWHVDEVIVADNNSTDGTREILERLPVELRDDPERGYWQARKITALALEALERGHKWVLPCDADEIFHAGDTTLRLADFFSSLPPDVMIVEADIFIHLATTSDPEMETNPVVKIGYRQRLPNGVKVACRLRPDLTIEMGNHSARTEGAALRIKALNMRHFTYRTADQMVQKIRNGIEAYQAAEGIGVQYGVGWRMWENATDEAIREHFRRWFFVRDPEHDSDLIFDPAPVMDGLSR